MYRPVGGAMAHSRLSLQPRAPPRARTRARTDTSPHPRATSPPRARSPPPRPGRSSCSTASEAGGRFEARGRRVARRANPPRKPPSPRTRTRAWTPTRVSTRVLTEVPTRVPRRTRRRRRSRRPATSRLSRFGAFATAALAAAAAAVRAAAAAAAAGNTLKRAAAAPLAPLPPSRFPRRDHEAGVPRENAESADDPDPSSDPDASSEWQMLRLSSGEVVFFGAPDAHPSRVASWISGETPWPEIRVMELSRRERTHLDVPTRAPGPMASNALAETAKEELRVVAREDAERAAIEADANAEASGAVGRTAVARLPPGSTATPQRCEHHRTVGARDGRRGRRRAGARARVSRADTSDAAFERCARNSARRSWRNTRRSRGLRLRNRASKRSSPRCATPGSPSRAKTKDDRELRVRELPRVPLPACPRRDVVDERVLVMIESRLPRAWSPSLELTTRRSSSRASPSVCVRVRLSRIPPYV